MVKNTRVTYRRRHCYNTKSNSIRKVKTPGTFQQLCIAFYTCSTFNRVPSKTTAYYGWVHQPKKTQTPASYPSSIVSAAQNTILCEPYNCTNSATQNWHMPHNCTHRTQFAKPNCKKNTGNVCVGWVALLGYLWPAHSTMVARSEQLHAGFTFIHSLAFCPMVHPHLPPIANFFFLFFFFFYFPCYFCRRKTCWSLCRKTS